MYGKRQQVLMFEKNFLETDSVADDNILRTENCACKVTAIGATEHLDQVFVTCKGTHQLMDQLNILHETPCFHILRRHVTFLRQSKHCAKRYRRFKGFKHEKNVKES